VLGALVLALLAPTPLAAAPKVREQDGERRVEAKGYSAVVAADGCLTSLEAGGTQLLAAGVGVSRGGYAFQGAVLAYPELSTPRRDTVLAQGPQGSLRYAFEEDGLTITVKNKGSQPLHYFLVLAAEVQGVRLGEDRLGRAPRQTTDARGRWYGGSAYLQVRDAVPGWGPWSERHQVLDLEVAGGAERSLALGVGPASEAERAALEALRAPPPEPDLAVLHPQPWQVLQRDARRGADVEVRVRLLLAAIDGVEARVRPPPTADLQPGPWVPLAAQPGTRAYVGRLRVPEGWGHVLEVRARKGGVSLVEARVTPFGVGEVFVIAGQSNSTNCGEARRQPRSGKVSTFDGRTWRAAEDPQPGCHDKSQGGSPWPAFGDALVERLGVPVGIASTGHGGTSVLRWERDGELFAWTLARIHALGPHGCRALLWHQGESDVGMRPGEYHDRMVDLIRATRDAAGWDLPWFVARATYHNASRPRSDALRGAQERLWREGEALEGPDTDALTGEHRDLGGHGIHFSATGLDAHGQLWALQVLRWLEPLLATAAGEAAGVAPR
jgi:hypothetical protein